MFRFNRDRVLAPRRANIGSLLPKGGSPTVVSQSSRVSSPSSTGYIGLKPAPVGTLSPYPTEEGTSNVQQDPELRNIYAYMSRKVLDQQKPAPSAPTNTSSRSSGGDDSYGLSALASMNLSATSNPFDRALKQLGIDYGNNRKSAALQGRRQDVDLAQLFARLGNYETNLKKNQAGVYDASGKALGKNYDQLLGEIQGSFKQGAGNTTNELQRLGIQEVSPAALAGLGQDASHLLNQARIDKTNAGTNNTANKNLFTSLMQEMIGSAGVEGTTQRGRAKQSTADALSALLQEYGKGKADLSGKKADALAQARMANLRAAISARASAARSARSANKMSPYELFVAKEQYKAAHGGSSKGYKPSGYNDAMSMLQAAAGNDPRKFQDLRTELDFINSKGITNTPFEHLTREWEQRGKYGQSGIDSLLSALAALNKKY